MSLAIPGNPCLCMVVVVNVCGALALMNAYCCILIPGLYGSFGTFLYVQSMKRQPVTVEKCGLLGHYSQYSRSPWPLLCGVTPLTESSQSD